MSVVFYLLPIPKSIYSLARASSRYVNVTINFHIQEGSKFLERRLLSKIIISTLALALSHGLRSHCGSEVEQTGIIC